MGEDGFEPAGGLGCGLVRVSKEMGDGRLHLLRTGYELEVAGTEEVFGILPGRGDKGYAAGEGFKDADGGMPVMAEAYCLLGMWTVRREAA